MALKIIESNGVFLVEGSLNTETAKLLKNHIDLLFQYYDDIVVNIDRITEIDATGLSVLRQLFNSSTRGSQSLFITGYGCKEIYDNLKTNYAA